MRRLRFLLALFLSVLTTVHTASQQTTSKVQQIASQAAIVFRGQVVAVEQNSPRAPDEISETRVTFRVDDGVRGVARGQLLTIRQWNVAPDEYRVGESLILFLHAPSSELGFSSPVGGRLGHMRVDGVTQEVLDSLRTTVVPRVTPVRQAGPKLSPPRQRQTKRGYAAPEDEQ